ncbi:MAG: RNA-binding cell elongation regulator Jag/EloR [Bacillota bacterium]|nr:RNA-binding cell elongation regulator Jag/EloR [Bacillota bacterium]
MSNAPEIQKEMEGTGPSISAAIEAVLKQINKDRDDVMVEILEKPRSGFLGIGAAPARVKVTYYEAEKKISSPGPIKEEPKQILKQKPQPAQPQKKFSQPAPAQKPKSQAAPAEAAQPKFTGGQESPAPPMLPASSEASQTAKQFIEGILPYFGVTATVEAKEDSEGNIALEILGDAMGVIIGRRGDTLDAMQYLCSLVVNRKEDKHFRIVIDTENYRAKREESLVRLAQKIAGKVVKYRKSMTLEPMNPYERRIIHSALQDYKGITTYSTGSEPNRRIVISLAGAQKSGGQQARRSGN